MSTNQPTPAPSKLQLILAILNASLAGLSTINPVVGEVSTLLGIFQNASALYTAETGKPIDLTLIPLETPVAEPTPAASESTST